MWRSIVNLEVNLLSSYIKYVLKSLSKHPNNFIISFEYTWGIIPIHENVVPRGVKITVNGDTILQFDSLHTLLEGRHIYKRILSLEQKCVMRLKEYLTKYLMSKLGRRGIVIDFLLVNNVLMAKIDGKIYVLTPYPLYQLWNIRGKRNILTRVIVFSENYEISPHN